MEKTTLLDGASREGKTKALSSACGEAPFLSLASKTTALSLEGCITESDGISPYNASEYLKGLISDETLNVFEDIISKMSSLIREDIKNKNLCQSKPFDFFSNSAFAPANSPSASLLVIAQLIAMQRSGYFDSIATSKGLVISHDSFLRDGEFKKACLSFDKEVSLKILSLVPRLCDEKDALIQSRDNFFKSLSGMSSEDLATNVTALLNCTKTVLFDKTILHTAASYFSSFPVYVLVELLFDICCHGAVVLGLPDGNIYHKDNAVVYPFYLIYIPGDDPKKSHLWISNDLESYWKTGIEAAIPMMIRISDPSARITFFSGITNSKSFDKVDKIYLEHLKSSDFSIVLPGENGGKVSNIRLSKRSFLDLRYKRSIAQAMPYIKIEDVLYNKDEIIKSSPIMLNDIEFAACMYRSSIIDNITAVMATAPGSAQKGGVSISGPSLLTQIVTNDVILINNNPVFEVKDQAGLFPFTLSHTFFYNDDALLALPHSNLVRSAGKKLITDAIIRCLKKTKEKYDMDSLLSFCDWPYVLYKSIRGIDKDLPISAESLQQRRDLSVPYIINFPMVFKEKLTGRFMMGQCFNFSGKLPIAKVNGKTFLISEDDPTLKHVRKILTISSADKKDFFLGEGTEKAFENLGLIAEKVYCDFEFIYPSISNGDTKTILEFVCLCLIEREKYHNFEATEGTRRNYAQRDTQFY